MQAFQQFQVGSLTGTISQCPINTSVVNIKGSSRIGSSKLYFYAADPADKRASFTGSGLPFPNATVAFSPGQQGEINIGMDGMFQFSIKMPNSYYQNLGSLQIPPTVYISETSIEQGRDSFKGIVVSDAIPYRSLTYPQERKNVLFYDSLLKLPVRGQEAIFRSGAYPKQMKQYDVFWGLKPPL